MPNPTTKLLTSLKENPGFMKVMNFSEKIYTIIDKVNIPLVLLGVRKGAQVKLLDDDLTGFFHDFIESIGLYPSEPAVKSNFTKEPHSKGDLEYSAEFGWKILGYPKCCCVELPADTDTIGPHPFFKELVRVCRTDPDFIKKERPDLRFVQHVPCSVNCRESLKLGGEIREVVEAMERLDILENGVENYIKMNGSLMFDLCQIFASTLYPHVKFIVMENYGTRGAELV